MLSIILAFHPNIVIAIIILGLSALIAANYGFARTFITIQVILLNGIASQDISLSIALLRITDVFAGVVIAAIDLLIFGRNAASTIINNTIANVVRTESKLFFKLFSKENYQFSEEEKKNISLELSIKINNMHNMYDSSIEELFNNKKKIRHYYFSIYLLDELSFLLERAIHLEKEVAN
ncbi:FUSC family protein [Mammaliicoccus lentus]|uniref:FUSC family protein n=1 Tax=Mammaliicoccus lentus TaxID=42858 RepID=UPI0026499DB6|nr:FUSC family protein [Mammaliicoccus lentus]